MQNCIDFLIEFLMTFGGFGRGLDPWFDWQGRFFHGVQSFQPRPEKPLGNYLKIIENIVQNEQKRIIEDRHEEKDNFILVKFVLKIFFFFYT